MKTRNENLPNILDLHINTRVITYTRAELLGIRRASRSFVCGSVLHVLKLNGLLRFRGCRAGRRKISVRISDRISHTTCRDRTTSRTSVLVPIVPEQRFRSGSYLKFCTLNARSVRNKSADLVSYVESSGADIFAVTETWLSEIDDACRAEITPLGYKLFDHTRSDRCGGGTALLIRENLHASRIDAGERTSFEFSHWMVEFQSKKKISFRKTKVVDVNLLCDELSTTSLCTDSPDALNDLVKCYNSTLSAALDRHAPLVTKFITVRPLVPWFSEDIRDSRRERRRAERKWRRSRSVNDLLEFKKKRNFTTYLMNEARRKFYSDFIVENNSNQRNLFSATKRLLNQGHEVPFPPTSDKLVLANEMGSFFVEKIDAIHVKLDRLADCLHDSHFDYVKTLPTRTLDSFIPLTESAVSKLIGCSPKKSCMFDPMSTSMVISCADVLLPVITKMINLSLNSGEFADDWKCGLINPILKKPGLDLLYKNYRPVSNLQYVSKLTEKVVFNQVYDHMVSNAIFPTLQSSYRQFHSTETALIKVMNDILSKMNSQHVTMLILLDLSAAFDTVDHRILLERLSDEVGIRGTALNWFRSYLSDRSQCVSVHGVLSRPFDLNCGVPQGSCLGPLLFIIYASKLFKIVEHHLPDAHCFADDTQLYLSFKPLGNTAQADAIQAMEKCIDAVRKWMIQDRLMINDDNTEFLLVGTRQQLDKLDSCSITVDNNRISPSPCVRNLGSWFDSNLSMTDHINKACNAAFYHLHNLRRIKKYLSRDSLITLVHAFITSRLDYCNGLSFGLPNVQIAKLQRVQNAAARFILGFGKFSHITPALYELHWLPVSLRIDYKILLLTFKCIYGLAPTYLSDLISIKSNSLYNLRSTGKLLLDHPKGKMLTTLGARSFSEAATKLWNELPVELRQATSLNSFKSRLKTYLFKKYFL